MLCFKVFRHVTEKKQQTKNKKRITKDIKDKKMNNKRHYLECPQLLGAAPSFLISLYRHQLKKIELSLLRKRMCCVLRYSISSRRRKSNRSITKNISLNVNNTCLHHRVSLFYSIRNILIEKK